MKKSNKNIFWLIVVIGAVLASGALVSFVRTPQEVAIAPVDENTQVFTSKTSGVSFAYPSTFFVQENEKGITVSPMAFDDVRQASSQGIVSNLTIVAHPGSYLKDISATVTEGADVKQEELLLSGHPAVLYYYMDDHGGGKNYTLFVEYSSSLDKTTLLEMYYTSSLESTYKKLLESLVVAE